MHEVVTTVRYQLDETQLAYLTVISKTADPISSLAVPQDLRFFFVGKGLAYYLMHPADWDLEDERQQRWGFKLTALGEQVVVEQARSFTVLESRFANETHPCQACGQPTRGGKRAYCDDCVARRMDDSVKRSRAASKARGVAPRTCKACGAEVGPRKHYCSECAEKHKPIHDILNKQARAKNRTSFTCRDCGASVDGQKVYCSACLKARKRAYGVELRARKKAVTPQRFCLQCQTVEVSSRAQYCKPCARQRELEKQREADRLRRAARHEQS